MFESLKKKYAHFVIRKKYLNKDVKQINYNSILSEATDFFFIMPKEDNDFYHSLDILRYFLIHKKIITLFLPEHKYNLIPEKEKYKFISYMPEQINRFFLPTLTLREGLQSREFDAVIDLNRAEDIFFSAIANTVRSKVRIAFSRHTLSNYYNLLITDKNPDGELAYRSFLTYLKMF